MEEDDAIIRQEDDDESMNDDDDVNDNDAIIMGEDDDANNMMNEDDDDDDDGDLRPHPLIQAAEGGEDSTRVQELLSEEGVNDVLKDRALQAACRGGHLGLAKLLVRNGATVTPDYWDTESALHCACKAGSLEVVKWLIVENGANFHARTLRGETPLHFACRGRNLEIIAFLIQLGADVHAKRSTHYSEWTPLHEAIDMGFLEGAKLLVEKGAAKINLANSKGETPLHLASGGFADNLEVFKYLLDMGADVHAKDADGMTPLMRAVAFAHLEKIEILIGLGAHLDAKNNKGECPLHYLLGWKSLSNDDGDLEYIFNNDDAAVVRLLVENGADVHSRDRDEKTLVHVACSKGLLETAELLMQNGADVNAKDKNGQTPLHVACQEWEKHEYSERTVKFLVEHGADLSAENRLGMTPFHVCCGLGHLETAKFLHECGADVNCSNNTHGKTPLWIACKYGHLDVVQFLHECGAHVNCSSNTHDKIPLWIACKYGHLDVVQFLLSQGADLCAKTTKGTTALQIASEKNQLKVVWYLVRYHHRVVLE